MRPFWMIGKEEPKDIQLPSTGPRDPRLPPKARTVGDEELENTLRRNRKIVEGLRMSVQEHADERKKKQGR